FVVNKADREGVDRTLKDIRGLQSLGQRGGDSWTAPLIKAVATEGVGVAELADAIAAHGRYLPASGEAAQRDRRRAEHILERLVLDRLQVEVARAMAEDDGRDGLLARLVARETDPYSEAERLVGRLLGR